MIMEERKGTLLKAAFAWEDLKLNSDGMVCVVVQDDKNKDVLIVAYMTILARVDQVGAACHTGSRSCFFKEIAKKNTEQ